jgi:hypothetical protein
MTQAQAYIPGVCNINPTEVAKRRLLGRIGLLAYVCILILFLVISINRFYRILLFLPALLGASGYLQAKNKFCVGYAGSGMENASIGSEEASKVINHKDVSTDKNRAKQMNIQAAAIAAAFVVIALLLPHV